MMCETGEAPQDAASGASPMTTQENGKPLRGRPLLLAWLGLLVFSVLFWHGLVSACAAVVTFLFE